MTLGERVVAEARTWRGTPFHPQASCKHAGADCAGLITGVARELNLPAANSIYAGMADYQRVDPELLQRGLAETMDLVDEAQPGDLLLLVVAHKPQHLAVYCGNNRMIHTYYAGPSMVIEVPMGRSWWRAVHSIWRWRA